MRRPLEGGESCNPKAVGVLMRKQRSPIVVTWECPCLNRRVSSPGKALLQSVGNIGKTLTAAGAPRGAAADDNLAAGAGFPEGRRISAFAFALNHVRSVAQVSSSKLVQQALHHGWFGAFRRLDEAKTLHRVSSPEAANRDEQIQIASDPIRHDRL